jgi:alpha-L-fucosidase
MSQLPDPLPQDLPAPLPRVARFERLAFGLFLHWGLYSLLGRGEWVMHNEKIAADEYAMLKDRFTAGDFDARAIARLARQAGMRYITLSSRHHDGFSLYDTRGLSDFDAMHSPARRDLIAEFVEGCRAEGVEPLLYHTTLDWRWNSAGCDPRKFEEYLAYLHESVRVLCTHYGPLGGLWFDGNWSRPEADWKEDRLYGLIRELQPQAIIVNNTGLHARGQTGHPEIDAVTFEQGRPTPMDRRGMPKYLAAEMCQTMNQHWGIGEQDISHKSPGRLIEDLCACRKVGANFLLNVGPTAGGAIPDYEAAVLGVVGRWTALHARAIYETRPTTIECDGRDFVLAGPDGVLYYFAHDLRAGGDANVATGGPVGPGTRVLRRFPGPVTSARWIDSEQGPVTRYDAAAGRLELDCTRFPYGRNMVVRVAQLRTAKDTC